MHPRHIRICRQRQRRIKKYCKNTSLAYPTDYNETGDIAKVERDKNARPEIANLPVSIDAYTTILVGYPTADQKKDLTQYALEHETGRINPATGTFVSQPVKPEPNKKAGQAVRVCDRPVLLLPAIYPPQKSAGSCWD